MNIIFICGCLEPGRDGVGDYIRRFACEIIKLGHKVRAVSIFEKQLQEELRQFQLSDGLNVLRIPSKFSKNQAILVSKSFIKDFNPDLISLQFVPYSFHAKGIPWGIDSFIAALTKPYPLHIMFHEIWLNSVESFGQFFIRYFQKQIIKNLNRSLNPKLINVSIPYNKKRLEEVNIHSEVLGLFGNISFNIEENFNSKTILNEIDSIKILYFGGAPRGEFTDQVVEGLLRFCENVTSEIVISIVSENSKNKHNFIGKLKSEIHFDNVKILDLGFLEEKQLSDLLSESSFGIVRSEPLLLGKSGSAIAMLEHGLPIWMPKLKSKNDLCYEFRSEIIFESIEKAILYKKIKPFSLLPGIANEFIHQLKL